MKTTEQIQEQYAIKNNYECFADLLLGCPSEIDWHVSNVQKEYAKELTDVGSTGIKIRSVETIKDGAVFSLGDTIKFSDRYDNFILEKITHNTNERRIELHGEGLFCSLLSSDCVNLSTQIKTP